MKKSLITLLASLSLQVYGVENRITAKVDENPKYKFENIHVHARYVVFENIFKGKYTISKDCSTITPQDAIIRGDRLTKKLTVLHYNPLIRLLDDVDSTDDYKITGSELQEAEDRHIPPIKEKCREQWRT